MPYTKEEKREYDKDYRAKNKEKRKEYQAENKEEKAAYNKKYSQTPQGKKSNIISHLKGRGMVGDLSFIYDNDYLNCKACWVCNHDFSKYKKSCDHDHTTGEFRQIICHLCNTHDNWMNHSEWV